MKNLLIAVFSVCLIILTLATSGEKKGKETFNEMINIEQVTKELNITPDKEQILRNRLGTVNQLLSDFHELRIQMEIIFTKEAGTRPRDQRRSIDAFTAEVLDSAKVYQQRIDQQVNKIKALFTSKELEKFNKIQLPNLNEPGNPIFGLFRRPTVPKDRQDMLQRRNRFRGGDTDFQRPDLEITFSHENHKEREVACITCHQSDDEQKIADAYQKPPAGSALMRRGPSYIAEMGTCTQCHNGETATEECSNCHPNWKPSESYLSNKINKFEDIKVGMEPPAFALKDINNKEYSLSQFKGEKIIVFQFGSST